MSERKHEEPLDDGLEEEEQDDEIIGQALRLSLVVVALLALIALAVLLWLRREPPPGPEVEIEAEAPQRVEVSAEPPAVAFTDVTREAGIDFVHESGARGDRFLPETMGAGGAFLDYDRDGDQDLLLINSRPWPGSGDSGPVPTSELYANDGEGRFTARGAELGLAITLYGTGVAVGDVDNDGYPDVFVAAVGENRLYRNVPGEDGERRFVDVTDEAGVAGDPEEWSSSSAFLDFDADGDLDLFVGNYVRWSKEIDLEVDYRLTGIGRAYGPPVNYRGTFPYLYRNRGDGSFEDVSEEAGVRVINPATGEPVAKSLGVVPLDVDRDGWIDLLVANDTVRNFFFHNRGDGTFEELGELYGLAYGPQGNATGAMGLDGGYFRNSEDLAFAIGNFANEMTSFYVSQGDATLYADQAIGEGVGAPSRRMLTFGLFFFDYDLDGRLDLLQVNGHLETEIGTVDPSQQYRQSAQLFWNAGDALSATFVPVPPERTGDLGTPLVGRGASYADIDGDGDLDVLLLQTGERAVLLRNEQQLGHHWLRFVLRGNGASVNRDAIGAWVELEADGEVQRRQVMPSRSYQSQVELPLTFGLGAGTQVERAVVQWPDGTEQPLDLTSLELDREHRIEQDG
jgi:hypothetical protein